MTGVCQEGRVELHRGEWSRRVCAFCSLKIMFYRCTHAVRLLYISTHAHTGTARISGVSMDLQENQWCSLAMQRVFCGLWHFVTVSL